MLKKWVLVVGALWAMSMVACSGDSVAGGGSIDPNTIAEVSSSSVAREIESSSSEAAVLSSSSREADSSQKESSSSGENNHSIKQESSSSTRSMTESSSSDGGGNNSIVPIELSSSSEFRDGGIARTNDFSIRCVDAGDVREQASAYKSVAGDVVVFALQNVQFDIPCDVAERDEYIEFLNTEKPFPIGHEGDTLFVRPFLAEGIDYACSCAASAIFSLDKNYSGIGFTAFGRQDPIPVQEN
ncbi:MAG: hypothetical protein IKX42_08790 [Fibrobacter sp.]|nr:hypothetical protein [Fibrobacter sp.]